MRGLKGASHGLMTVLWRSQLEEVDQLASSTTPPPGKHFRGNQIFDSHQPPYTPV
jgi:hypothetical protein